MHTQYIANPGTPGTCLHNTAQWQVTELMGGLACELLYKTRSTQDFDRRHFHLSLHDCYPSVFLQGDDATHFLQELSDAQERLSPRQVDALLLDEYTTILN